MEREWKIIVNNRILLFIISTNWLSIIETCFKFRPSWNQSN